MGTLRSTARARAASGQRERAQRQRASARRPSGRQRGSSQRRLQRRAQLGRAERALQARDDHALAVDREQPRLGAQVKGLQLRAQALAGLVVHVDLLVDEGDPVRELRAAAATATSVTGPHTREMHSCGVENSSATGRLPSTWLRETEAICSGGRRVVSSDVSPWTVAAVSVAIAGGRWPTSGIGEDGGDGDLAGGPDQPARVRVSASTRVGARVGQRQLGGVDRLDPARAGVLLAAVLGRDASSGRRGPGTGPWPERLGCAAT